MRLLNTTTYQLESFSEPEIPRYAILSHRWEDEELTITDVESGKFAQWIKLANSREKALAHLPGFHKVELASQKARLQGLEYLWVDTCNIDKSSSAELTEAINSMFRWYQDASVCHAFLSDVDAVNTSTTADGLPSAFGSSAWFSRGWTLQELIAPQEVHFYDRNWSHIGSRSGLCEQLAQITGIHLSLLQAGRAPLKQALSSFTVAQRMSWAASRETTRVEDRAYSLMGIFGVNMPLLYGEGERAFVRLQEEILKVGLDLSMLAWSNQPRERVSRRGLLATSPSDFAHSADVVSSPLLDDFSSDEITVTMTNVGLRLEGASLILSPKGPAGRGLVLSLECRTEKDVTNVLALKLTPVVRFEEGASTLCYAGWDNDETSRAKRVTTVDIFHPKRVSSKSVVTIARDFFLPRLSRIDPAEIYTHVCLRLPRSSPSFHWAATGFFPEEAWDRHALTMDFRRAKVDQRLFRDSCLDEIQTWRLGAIAITDTLGNRVAISFGLKVGIFFRTDHCDAALDRTVTWVNDFDSITSSTLFIPGDRRLVLTLHALRRPGICIARLELSDETEVNHADAPYELDVTN